MLGKIHYLRTFSFLFNYEEWGNRLLMGSLMFLIPIVGPIINQGWAVETMHRRIRGEEGLPEMSDFGGLLKTGLTPFLAHLVGSFFISFVLIIMMGITGGLVVGTMALLHQFLGDSNLIEIIAGFLAAGLSLLSLVIIMLTLVAFQVSVIIVDVTGDLKSMLDYKLIRRLFKVMVKPIFLGNLVIVMLSTPLVLLGYMACLVGIYPAIFLSTLAGFELRTQIYRSYLASGHEPLATVSYIDGKPLTLGPAI